MISKMAPGYTHMMVLASMIFCHQRFLLYLVMKLTLLYYLMVEQMEMVEKNKIASETKWLSQLSIIFHYAVLGHCFPIISGIMLQGSYSFELFKFHDFPWLFPWPFQAFQDLKFSCQFQKYKTFTCFRAFFDWKKFNRHKLRHSPKRMPFTLLNYSSLSYIVLAFSSVVNNLSNRTLIFHDFQEPTIKFMTFQVFHDLYELCVINWLENLFIFTTLSENLTLVKNLKRLKTESARGWSNKWTKT